MDHSVPPWSPGDDGKRWSTKIRFNEAEFGCYQVYPNSSALRYDSRALKWIFPVETPPLLYFIDIRVLLSELSNAVVPGQQLLCFACSKGVPTPHILCSPCSITTLERNKYSTPPRTWQATHMLFLTPCSGAVLPAHGMKSPENHAKFQLTLSSLGSLFLPTSDDRLFLHGWASITCRRSLCSTGNPTKALLSTILPNVTFRGKCRWCIAERHAPS